MPHFTLDFLSLLLTLNLLSSFRICIYLASFDFEFFELLFTLDFLYPLYLLWPLCFFFSLVFYFEFLYPLRFEIFHLIVTLNSECISSLLLASFLWIYLAPFDFDFFSAVDFENVSGPFSLRFFIASLL